MYSESFYNLFLFKPSKILSVFLCCRSATVPVEVTVTPLGTRPPVIDAAAFTISVSEAVPVASSLWTVPVCSVFFIKVLEL